MDNTFDSLYYGEGRLLAGIDESGVSDIAGPLVAACVILPRINVDTDDLRIFEVNDSKKIPEKYRKKHAEVIWECAEAIGIGEASPDEVDFLGKRKATVLAMMRAIAACQNGKKQHTRPDVLLVDGDIELPTGIKQHAVRDGDAKSLSVAAASIIAKVYRDDVMNSLHQAYPFYNWHKNKGYPCEPQFKGMDTHGIRLGVHRTRFWPFTPNDQKPEDEPFLRWRRGLWRQKTLETLTQETGLAAWNSKELNSKNTSSEQLMKSKPPQPAKKSEPHGTDSKNKSK